MGHLESVHFDLSEPRNLVWTFDAAVDVSAATGTGLQADLGAGPEDPSSVVFIGVNALVVQYATDVPNGAAWHLQATPGGIVVPGGSLDAPADGTVPPVDNGVYQVFNFSGPGPVARWVFTPDTDASSADGTGLQASFDGGMSWEDPIFVAVLDDQNLDATYTGDTLGALWQAPTTPGGITVPRGIWIPGAGTINAG